MPLLCRAVGSRFEEYRQTVRASGGGGPEPEGAAVAGPSGQMSSFQQYRAEHGASPDQRVDLLGTYKQWYTGRNLDGPANGWDTKFMETAQSQYMKSLESGDPNAVLDRFKAQDAAGVVTWDGARGANGERYVFGDVIADGKKVGNVYDDMDRHTANVMMGEWTIQDGAKKARLNNAGDFEKAWDQEIQRIRTESTEQAKTAPRAYQMEQNTRARAEEEEVAGIVAAGMGGGAALGAAVGSFVPVIGTAVGAIGGAIVGGLSAWLNQDALSYQVAREREKLDMIREQGASGWAYTGELLSSASMSAYSTALSPLSNLIQGGYDVAKSGGFDASSGGAFYEVNDQGQRTAPGLIQVMDLAAKVGDAALTFSGSYGRMAYTAQMSTGIAGRAAGLAPGVGQWDPQKLEVDSVWTNSEGDFDLASAAAGVGYVGIEAVQLGGARGLFSRLQRNAGKQASEGASTVFERLNLSKEQRTVLREGGRVEQQAGWKFVTDAQGNLVGKGRATVAMLAPSEALQSLAAKAMARRAAAREAGAVEAEVLYQKAFNLASGEKKFQTALVNAFGEAQEEGIQTLLEPLKHEGSIDPEEVFRAAAGGFAAGLGMGAAAARTRPGQDQRFFEQARMAHFINTGGDTLEKSDWDQMTELQKRQLVRSSVMADAVVRGGWEKLEKDMIAAEQGDVVASDRVRDWYKTRVTAMLNAGSQKATDASLTIVMLDSARFRPDSLATSHGQLIKDQKARSDGIETQIENMTAERERVTDATRAAELDGQLAQMAQMLEASNQLLENFRKIGRKIDAAIESGDTARLYRLVDRLNDGIQQVYDMEPVPGLDDAALMVRAKAISRINTRHPEDSTASFVSFVPQVDPFFAEFKADGVAAVSQLTNKGMRSDFDGDKVHTLQQLMLNDKEYLDLRSGVNILGASLTPEIGTTPAEEWVLDEVRVAGSSTNDVVRALVDKLVKDIRDSLYAYYVDTGYIDRKVIDRVMKKVEDTVRSGGDARNVLLTEMSREAGSTLMEIGRGVKPHMGRLPLSNQFFVLAQMVTEHIQEFQRGYAEHRPRYGNPTAVSSSAGAHSTETRRRRQAKAGTVAAGIAEVAPGDNLFRMFQKLHYQLMNSTEMYVGWSGDNPDFQELAQFYEQISSGATGLKAEEQTPGDAIVGSVLSQLERLAKDERTLKSIDPGLTTMNNVALLANLETAQYVYAENKVTNRMEKQFTGKKVTLAQQLLYETLMKFRNNPANARVWDTDQSMASTFTTLMKLTKPSESGSDETLANEERAFLEIFEAVPLYDMVGQDAKALGVTLTVGQYYRRIKDMHPDLRRLEKGALDVYLARDAGAPGTVTPPLSLQSIDNGEVTTMRTLVDSLFSAARSEISVTKSGKTKGKVTGHMAQRNEDIRKEIHQTWAQVKAAMQKVMPQKEYTAADVQRFVSENPDIGRLLLKVIPDSIMPVVYKGTDDNGQARLASWFYDVWAQPNADAAEMRLRWRIWMDEWQAHVDGLNLDDDTPDDVKGVQYDRLTSRFHRLMYKLATLDQGDESYYQDLLLRGANSTSLVEFENWLNNVSGHLGMAAPMLGWVDDTAEFDATKTGSGWSQVRSTPQLREDLAALRSAAARKVGQVDDDARQWQADQVYIRSIKRGWMEATGQLKPSDVKPIDRERYQQFLAVIEQAKKRDLSYGPRAMVLNVAIGAYGIYGNATTKGAHPEHLNAVESLEAVLNAFGYTVNLERVLGDVTAHNEDAVAASPELIVKQGGRLTNSNGQQVQWAEQTVETLIPLMEDQKSLQLVMAMLQPQVMELGFDNKPRRQMLTKSQSMKSLLTSTESSNLYNDDTRPGLAQSMKYLSQLEARARGKNSFSVQQRVTEIVLARAAALERPASITDMEQMTIQAYMDLAAVLQEAGQVPATAQGDPLHEMWENLKKELRRSAAEVVYNIDRSTLMDDQDLESFLKQQLTNNYEEQIRALRTEAATTTGAMQAQLLKMADDMQARWDRDIERLEDMLNRDVVGQTVSAYGYDASMDDIEKAERQTVLAQFVADHLNLMEGAGESLPLVRKILRALYSSPAADPNLTDEQWETLSKRIISLQIQNQVTTGSPTSAPPPFPGDAKEGRLDTRRYWDYTFSFLADFLDPNATDGLLEAARADAVAAGRVATGKDSNDVMQTLLNTIYHPDNIGEWTPAIPIQGIEQNELLTGASSVASISMAGLLTQRWAAVSAATKRTNKVPPPDLDTTVELLWSDLDWEDSKDETKKKNLYDHKVELILPGGKVRERPLIEVHKRFARSAVFTYPDPADPTQRVTVDLMANPKVATQFTGDVGISTDSGLREININRMREEIRRTIIETGGDLNEVEVNIAFLHPEAQPATEDYYNNLWFEGTIFDSVGDVSDSLLYSLWFGADGINARVQQAALDTRKKGTFGVEAYTKPDLSKVAELERDAEKDFAAMLAGKAKIIMLTDLGDKSELEPEFYNGIHKLLKLKHFVDGTVDGKRRRFTAEEIIANQLKFGEGYWDENGNQLRDAELWIASDQVLAEMMGEQGFGGVPGRFLRERLTTAVGDTPAYRGWSDRMGTLFPVEQSKSTLRDSLVGRTLRVTEPLSALELDPVQQNLFKKRQEAFRTRQAAVRSERQSDEWHGFDPRRNLDYARDQAERFFSAEDVTLNLPKGIQWASLPPADVAMENTGALHQYISAMAGQTGGTVSGWVYQHEGAFNLNRGQLTKADLGKGLKMMPGDLVILDVSSFGSLSPADARKEMADVISYLASQQVAVVPVASGGPSSLTAEARHQLLNDFRYQRYGDSPRVLVPDVMVGRRFANAASHRSSLTTVQDVTVRKQRIMGLLRDRDPVENTMVVPTNRPSRFSTYQLVGNILPTNVAARFGVPQTTNDLNKVRRTLEGLNTAAGISFLQKLGKVDANGNYSDDVIQGKKDDKSFAVAWKTLMDRIDAAIAEKTTLPVAGTENWGTGDLVPLLSDTGELLLYRHGYKFPYENLEAQLAQNLNGETGPRRVAVYGAPDPAATTHKGTVSSYKDRRRHGIQLELEVDANVLGSKQIFEVDGMKWLAAPLGKQFEEPNAPILGNNIDALWIDGYGSLHDVLSKQATEGLVNGFRNGIAFFGNDFLQDAADFLNVTPDQARQILKAVERSGNKLSIDEVVELSSVMNGGISAQTAAIARLISDLTSQNIDTGWIGRLTEDTAGAYITRSMVLYLMSEGAQLKDIQYSSGLWLQKNTEPNAVSRRMPRLFTNMLDAAPIGSPLRNEMFRRFNSKMGQNGVEGWTLDQAWTLIGTLADGTEIEMDLAFGEAHISDDNPELNVQAQNRKRRQGTSMHAARVTEFGVGGEVFPDPKKLAQIDQVLDKKPDKRLESGELWKSMTKVNKVTFGPGSQWQRDTPMEQQYRELAIARYVAYRTAIDYEQESLQDDRPALMSKRADVLRAFGLSENQGVLVDYWARQMLWRPGIMPGQINYDDVFSPNDLFQVMDEMISNATNGHFPTYNAAGPQMISEADLRVLFNAAQRGGWRPFTIEGDPSSVASLDRYGDWVYAAFGQAFNSDVEIDDAYLLDLDGHMNTYREFLKAQGHMLEVSLDKELVAKFLDPDTNELIAVSASPIQSQQLMEQVILPRVNIGFEGLQSGVGVAETQTGLDAQASWKSHSRRRVVEFRRKNKIRPTDTTSARHYVEYGSKVVQSNAELHSLSRILISLRHGTTMLNPGLYISMVPEQGFRIFLNGMANLLTGESTSRSVGGLTSRLSFTQFDSEQVEKLNKLYENLANNNAFAGMIIKDLAWQPPGADAPGGKIVKAFEKFAAVGNKWQDPTWGLPQKVLARVYVEAIMRSIQAMPVENVMTIESVIAHLQTDPGYFSKRHPELHQMASNAVADLRGLRNTPLSLAAKALYEPLTRSSSATVNFAGTLIKLPVMYANFTGNMLTTLTGMQGYSQILATFLDGRRTPFTLMHRLAKAAKGEKLTAEDDIRYDMSSTFDGYTIANAFIRGGVTQTGLFMLGMLTGGVLSGDDEEARRRRRLAQAMGVPQIADPRRMEADFRNKDMLFLDWMPPQLQAMFNIAEENEAQGVRAGVQMSWLMKPFLSPILGMERFFKTGDFGWITYGFMDGVGSLPLFNKAMWDDTVRAAEELQALAAEQQELSTPDSTRNTLWLLTSAVGLYENMLLENMFINSVYAGMDTWDRDPTKTQLLDSDGTIQRTIDNTARPNDLALEDYVDDEGNVQRAFVNRNDRDRALAYFTENRGTAAFILSVATGFQKGLSRYSMPVKMQEIELPETGERQTMEFALAALNSAWQAQGGPPKAMTLEEITKYVAGDAASKGDWDTYNNVDAIAAALYAETPQWNAMSVLGPDGEEELTREGIDAVVKGLQRGTIDLDSPAIRQIAIDFDTREKIQADFLADVTQQGVDVGLTNTQAVDRAERLFYGPYDDPSVVGFADILWSDKIPYSNTRKYQQLNTTYVPGPDGFPWATGFGRTGPLQQIGLPKKPVLGFSGATTMDGRMNTVDLAVGINTGLRGLVPFDDTQNIPTDKEIGDAIVKAIEDLELKTNDFEPFDNSNSSGRYYKRGGLYRNYGSYGGGGSSYSGGLPRIYFSKMPYMASGRNVYGDTTKNIFWDNAQIRRTRIRRERYQSQRGRLNQWQ